MLNKLKNRFATFFRSDHTSPEMVPPFTFATFQAMAQAYDEKRKEPPLLPATIETMRWAYNAICSGEDPWTALGNFTNAWYGYARHLRADLVCEPLQPPAQQTEYTCRWAAFCAASVEFLCECYDIACPEWIYDPSYVLTDPWWRMPQPQNSSMRDSLMRKTPVPFARRNIFCSNRLFQNKYEAYEWIQEAIEKGITTPGEIHRYVRQKEISIYGA